MAQFDSRLERQYAEKTPTSRRLYEKAREIFPSGITHDSRFLKPYPLAVERAVGSHKWDADGHEYIDYFGGHGALLFGHSHPAIAEAVRDQIGRGTHYGASHELELQWAELVTQLVPCAEKVRFTSSGTEATQLCMRVARAFTGKDKILRFTSHFHGWHDQVAFGAVSHYDGSIPAGVTDQMAEQVVVCPPNDIEALRQTLSSRDDVGGVILEPTGSSFGHTPVSSQYVQELRKVTKEYGVLLIFDEVITGFRVARGGAQEHYGVTPDLTTLAKMLAGGLPGGAVAGRADIMDVMTFRDDPEWNQRGRVAHQGTYNANPLSARAGITALNLVATTDACTQVNQKAAALRGTLNDVIREHDLNWHVYGTFSGFHLFTNHHNLNLTLEEIESGDLDYSVFKAGNDPVMTHKVRIALLVKGVDMCGWPGGWLSTAHSDADIDRTAEAFNDALALLKEDAALV